MALGRVRAQSGGVVVILPSSRVGQSSEGQDEFVIEALGAKRGGYFIDSGASDGITGSNTYRLETTYGWDGICVEPNDFLFAMLRRNRRARCVNCCLRDGPGVVDFFEEAGVYGGIVSDYDPAHLRYIRQRFAADLNLGADGSPRYVRKGVRAIGEVLRAHAAPPVIDYWSLDTEGSELAVLRGFPFGELTVTAITVEHNHSADRARIQAFLESRGYARVRALGIDDCYLLGGATHGSGWRSAAFVRRRRARDYGP